MPRHLPFMLFSMIALALFHEPVLELLLSFRRDIYAHIVLIPLVSAWFFYRKRDAIVAGSTRSYAGGITGIALGMALYAAAVLMKGQGHNDRMSLIALSLVLLLTGGFVLFYGFRALRVAAFPFVLLLFMIPLPAFVLEGIIGLLQIGTAEAADTFFWLARIPYEREGMLFHFEGLSIEVAENCSGIRSSLALLITGLIAGQLFLTTLPRRAALLAWVLPITIVKNSLRILVLTTGALYVDQSVLTSDLHRNGGILFFALALSMLGLVLFFLRKKERGPGSQERG